MSLSAAVLDALEKAGATREQLLAAMKADIAEREAAEAAKLEKKRASNRDRQKRKRERDGNAESRVTGVTARDERDPAPLNENNLNPPPDPQDISDEISPPVEKSTEPKVEPEHVLEAWNAMADENGLPKARLTPERRKKLNTFVRRHPIDDITEAIWAIPRSRFLCGENDRSWKADLDFFLQPKSFTRILEGSYAH